MIKFVIKAKALKDALAVHRTCRNDKGSRIFNCVRMRVDVEDNGLYFESTDMEWYARTWPAAEIRERCDMLASFGFLEKLSKLKDVDAFQFHHIPGEESDGRGQLGVKWTTEAAQGSQTALLDNPDKFPAHPFPEDLRLLHTIEGLGKAIVEAKPYVGGTNSQPVLQRVALSEGCVIASDGRALYRRLIPGLPACGAFRTTKHNAKVIRSICNVARHEKGVLLSGPGFVLCGRGSDEDFPDVASAIPPDSAPESPVDPSPWASAVASLFGTSKDPDAWVEVVMAQGRITFNGKAGASTGSVTVTDVTCTREMTINLNPAKLLMVLKLKPTRVLCMGPAEPARFVCEDGLDLVLAPMITPEVRR